MGKHIYTYDTAYKKEYSCTVYKSTLLPTIIRTHASLQGYIGTAMAAVAVVRV